MTAEIQDNVLINKNPRNLSEIISEQTISTDFEIDKMVYKSAKAFKTWSQIPAPERAKYLTLLLAIP